MLIESYLVDMKLQIFINKIDNTTEMTTTAAKIVIILCNAIYFKH